MAAAVTFVSPVPPAPQGSDADPVVAVENASAFKSYLPAGLPGAIVDQGVTYLPKALVAALLAGECTLSDDGTLPFFGSTLNMAKLNALAGTLPHAAAQSPVSQLEHDLRTALRQHGGDELKLTVADYDVVPRPTTLQGQRDTNSLYHLDVRFFSNVRNASVAGSLSRAFSAPSRLSAGSFNAAILGQTLRARLPQQVALSADTAYMAAAQFDDYTYLPVGERPTFPKSAPQDYLQAAQWEMDLEKDKPDAWLHFSKDNILEQAAILPTLAIIARAGDRARVHAAVALVAANFAEGLTMNTHGLLHLEMQILSHKSAIDIQPVAVAGGAGGGGGAAGAPAAPPTPPMELAQRLVQSLHTSKTLASARSGDAGHGQGASASNNELTTVLNRERDALTHIMTLTDPRVIMKYATRANSALLLQACRRMITADPALLRVHAARAEITHVLAVLIRKAFKRPQEGAAEEEILLNSIIIVLREHDVERFIRASPTLAEIHEVFALTRKPLMGSNSYYHLDLKATCASAEFCESFVDFYFAILKGLGWIKDGQGRQSVIDLRQSVLASLTSTGAKATALCLSAFYEDLQDSHDQLMVRVDMWIRLYAQNLAVPSFKLTDSKSVEQKASHRMLASLNRALAAQGADTDFVALLQTQPAAQAAADGHVVPPAQEDGGRQKRLKRAQGRPDKPIQLDTILRGALDKKYGDRATYTVQEVQDGWLKSNVNEYVNKNDLLRAFRTHFRLAKTQEGHPEFAVLLTHAYSVESFLNRCSSKWSEAILQEYLEWWRLDKQSEIKRYRDMRGTDF